MRIFVASFFFLSLLGAHARASFHFDKKCIEAYKKIMNLEIGEGRRLLQQVRKTDPENLIPVLLDNYADFFTLLTSENPDEFNRLKGNIDTRLDLIRQGEKNSPYYLYSQAVINLQWALMKAKFQEYWGAAWEIKHANSALEDLSKKFPNFLPADLDRGILLALLGSLPSSMHFVMGTFGLQGDTPGGMKLMESTLKKMKSSSYEFLADETALYISFIQASVTEDKKVFKTSVDRCARIGHESLLKTYVLGLVGLRSGHSEEAIELLKNRPSGKTYADFYILDYMLGSAKLNRLDTDAAVYLQRFQKNYKGTSFLKDSWLKMAWIAQLQNNQVAYNMAISKVTSSGYDYTDKDKQALKEAAEGKTSVPLLKARLYFDGGYYTQAMSALEEMNPRATSSPKSRLEFLYRRARIEEAQGNEVNAHADYQGVIDQGKNSPLYFAANSALRKASLYEKTGDKKKAQYFYQIALDMHEEEYKSSLDNKAKEGLKRVSAAK